MEEFIDKELETLSLGDKRLNKRCKSFLKTLMQSPKESIPAACKGYAEIIAGYRFLDNPGVSFQQILKPHEEATKKRIEKEDTIIVPQDTTGIDHTKKRGSETFGYLENKNMRGVFLHPSIALTPDGLVLGTFYVECWSRNIEELGKTQQRKDLPIEKKESHIWISSIDSTVELAEQYPDKLIINVADRECDIAESLSILVNVKDKIKGVVRCAQDRNTIEEDEQTLKVFERAKNLPLRGTKEILVKQDNKYRNTTVEVRSGEIKIKAPRRKENKVKDIEINVIYAKERTIADGHEAIEWLLYTTLEVNTMEESGFVLDTYACRWYIEIYFKILKQGCQIEKLQLETKERFMTALALYMIIAWREMFLMTLGRKYPELPADSVFSKEEWEAIFIIDTNQEPPKEAPPLGVILLMIAKQGGYIGRKNDPQPGPKAFWIGLSKLYDYVKMYVKLKSLKTYV